MPITPEILLLLALAAFAAGFIDAIAGGGGLITLPALLLAGLPPVEALATNKLQGTFGVASASHAYWRTGQLDAKALLPAFATTLAGSALGSLAVLSIDAKWLMTVMPLLLIAVALYFLMAPSVSSEPNRKPRMAINVLAPLLGFTIGAYDGFFGPGTGSFFMLGFVALGGLGLITATANTKLLNFASNIASLAVFAASGHVAYVAGLLMAVGQVLGAQLGARMALAHGARIIRPLVIAVALLVAMKLISDPANALGQWLRSQLA